MDNDLFYLIGVGFIPLAFVAFVAAWADRRRPWAGLILLVLALGLIIAMRILNGDGAYGLSELPDLFMTTARRYWN